MENMIRIIRKIDGKLITVFGEYEEERDTWEIVVSVDGEVVDEIDDPSGMVRMVEEIHYHS